MNIKSFRLDLMDLYFGTVASLLALLMRGIIQNTLNDLVTFFNDYQNGNDYKDSYTNLGLSHLLLPFTCYLKPNRELAAVNIDPNFGDTLDMLNEIVDTVVDSLNTMPRIETYLFQTTQGDVQNSYYNMVRKDEELVVNCKNRVKEIVMCNSIGPNQYV